MKKLNMAVKLAMLTVTMTLTVFFARREADAQTITTPVVVDENTSITALPNHNMVVPVTGKTVTPIQITEPGQLYIRVNGAQLTDNAKISLYTDEACTINASSSSYFILSPNETKVGEILVLQSGTYYLEVKYGNESSANKEGMVNVTPYLFSRIDRDLTSGAWSSLIAPSYYGGNYVYCKVTVPSKGYIGIEANTSSLSNINVTLFKKDKTEIVESGFQNGIVKYYPVSKGTYYIGTKGAYDGWTKLKYTVTTRFTIKENIPFSYSMMGRADIDFRFKAKKTGVVTLVNGSDYDVYGVLLNDKKKTLSESKYGKSFSYAVKKGATYNFRVTNYGGADAIGFTISKTALVDNGTKKKAALLKKDKKSSCLIVAGEAKKKYWYQINVDKNSKLKVDIANVGSGKVVYYLYNKSGQGISGTLKNNRLKSKEKVTKGTYYLVIVPAAKTSGRINLTLK